MTALPKQLEPWKHLISEIYRDGDGAWNVGLKNGWIYDAGETHAVAELKLSTVVSIFKAKAIVRCDCRECNRDDD